MLLSFLDMCLIQSRVCVCAGFRCRSIRSEGVCCFYADLRFPQVRQMAVDGANIDFVFHGMGVGTANPAPSFRLGY